MKANTHAYQQSDVPPDHKGDIPCACGLAKRNQHHDVHPATLPATPADVTEREARLLGEGGDR